MTPVFTNFGPAPLFLLLGLCAAIPAAASEQLADVRIAQALDNRFPRPTVGFAAATTPALTFYVELRFSCPAGTRQRTLFTSIADASRTDVIPDGQPSPVTVRLDVPTWQVPWLEQPQSACTSMLRRPDETGGDGTRYFRLHAAASAHVTLTCQGDDGRETAADSAMPLEAWLSCPAAPPT